MAVRVAGKRQFPALGIEESGIGGRRDHRPDRGHGDGGLIRLLREALVAMFLYRAQNLVVVAA